MPWRVVAAFAVTMSGCVEFPTSTCGEIVCPAGTVCVATAGGCFADADVAACSGVAELGACAVDGLDGNCIDGVCRTSFCGDGVVDAPAELCDDDNREPDDSCSPDCREATCLVPVTHATVQAAVDDESCATVYLSGGRYTENVLISRDVTIENPGASVATLDGGGLGTTITVGQTRTVTISDVEITGGQSDECGGGLFNEGNLTLDSVRVIGNESSDSGGGICHVAGSLLLFGVLVDDNHVTATAGADRGAVGGGIFATATVIALPGTVISNNSVSDTTASSGGGGIYVANASLDFLGGVLVDSNRVEVAGGTEFGSAIGGGVYGDNSAVRITNSTITNNLAYVSGSADPASMSGFSVNGGGLALTGGPATVAGSLIEGNIARTERLGGSSEGMQDVFSAQGGGLTLGTTMSMVDRTVFRNNRTEVIGPTTTDQSVHFAAGAAVTAGGNSIDITTSEFDSNVSSAAGGSAFGGAVLLGNAVATVADCSFRNNSASGMFGVGGAIHGGLIGGTLRILLLRSTIANNSATTIGGGISTANIDPTQVELVNSTVSGNSAMTGGAIGLFADAQTSLSLANVTIGANTASVAGGGFYSEAFPGGAGDPSILFQKTAFGGNTSPSNPDCQSPGPITGDAAMMLDLSQCTISGFNNYAADPQLEPLGDNGGRTRTHALPLGSPAIDAAFSCGIAPSGGAIVSDQRGLQRDDMCDLGAYERQ